MFSVSVKVFSFTRLTAPDSQKARISWYFVSRAALRAAGRRVVPRAVRRKAGACGAGSCLRRDTPGDKPPGVIDAVATRRWAPPADDFRAGERSSRRDARRGALRRLLLLGNGCDRRCVGLAVAVRGLLAVGGRRLGHRRLVDGLDA